MAKRHASPERGRETEPPVAQVADPLRQPSLNTTPTPKCHFLRGGKDYAGFCKGPQDPDTTVAGVRRTVSLRQEAKGERTMTKRLAMVVVFIIVAAPMSLGRGPPFPVTGLVTFRPEELEARFWPARDP